MRQEELISWEQVESWAGKPLPEWARNRLREAIEDSPVPQTVAAFVASLTLEPEHRCRHCGRGIELGLDGSTWWDDVVGEDGADEPYDHNHEPEPSVQ
jgi:hypothetical protein